jgi:hypothetical protein
MRRVEERRSCAVFAAGELAVASARSTGPFRKNQNISQNARVASRYGPGLRASRATCRFAGVSGHGGGARGAGPREAWQGREQEASGLIQAAARMAAERGTAVPAGFAACSQPAPSRCGSPAGQQAATSCQADPGQLRARMTDTAATLPGRHSQTRTVPTRANPLLPRSPL